MWNGTNFFDLSLRLSPFLYSGTNASSFKCRMSHFLENGTYSLNLFQSLSHRCLMLQTFGFQMGVCTCRRQKTKLEVFVFQLGLILLMNGLPSRRLLRVRLRLRIWTHRMRGTDRLVRYPLIHLHKVSKRICLHSADPFLLGS